MSYSKQFDSKISTSSCWKMPPAHDLLKIAGLTMIPSSIMFLGWCWYDANGKQSKILFDKLSKPSWAITNTSQIATFDYATVLPMGYALFLVTKNGTSSSEVKTALGAFAATMGTITLGTIAFSGSHNLQCWAGACAAITATAGLTASLFGKLDQTAGWCMVPFVAWSTFTTFQMIATYFKNKDTTFTFVKKDPTLWKILDD